jgi:hypothetical protein
MKFISAVVLWLLAASATPQIFYTGQWQGGPYLESGINTLIEDARIYENFENRSLLAIDSVFGSYLFDGEAPEQLFYEFRQGVSAGNGGTIVASGTVSANAVKTGRFGFGMIEWELQAEISRLTIGIGHYWFAVTPVGTGAGHYYSTTTDGTNGIGQPLHDGNSFYDSTSLGANFDSTTEWLGPGIWDFSQGFDNHVIPEPTTIAGGLIGITMILLRRTGQRKS